LPQQISVLVNCPINIENRGKLPKYFNLYFAEEVPDINALLDKIGNEIQIIISDGPRQIDAKLMDQMPNLKLICLQSVGIDHIDIDTANKRNIQVTNAAETNAASCADHAFALMLSLYRNIIVNNRNMHSNGADEEIPFARSNTIYGKNIGILGLGAIGCEVAKRAAAFDMEIFYHNRTKRGDVPFNYCSTLKDLANKIDILVVSCPGGDATKNIVNSSILKALGASGTLINVARGSIVDTNALVRALQGGVIKNAGLDVIGVVEHERNLLCNMDHVVMSPHIAGNTDESWLNRSNLIRQILTEFRTKKPLTNQL
jgi:lactate dehydrogenase-like 2-hydroxyacid dehydrogenase